MNSVELRKQIKEEFKQLQAMMKKEMEDFLKSQNLDGDVTFTDRNKNKVKGRIMIVYGSGYLYPFKFIFYPYKKNGELSLKSKYNYFGNVGEDNFEKNFEAFEQYRGDENEKI